MCYLRTRCDRLFFRLTTIKICEANTYLQFRKLFEGLAVGRLGGQRSPSPETLSY